jgi:hypothetical protein
VWLACLDDAAVSFFDTATGAASRRLMAASDEAVSASVSALQAVSAAAERNGVWQLLSDAGVFLWHCFFL